jgi:hypothetical protein
LANADHFLMPEKCDLLKEFRAAHGVDHLLPLRIAFT